MASRNIIPLFQAKQLVYMLFLRRWKLHRPLLHERHTRQFHVPGKAKGIGRCSGGIAAPVAFFLPAFFLCIAPDGFDHGLAAMPFSSHEQGNPGILTG